jgi:hypothetical protein
MTKRVTEKNNFSYLTGALVVLLFGVSLADEVGFQLGQLLIQAAIIVVLTLGVWSIKSEARWYLTRAGLIVAILMVTVAGLFLQWVQMDLIWLVMLLAYLIQTTWLAMKQVLFTGPVDANKIVGAVCIFLLIGLIWTTLYMIIALLNPEAFYGLEPGAWYDNFADLVYFSYVSLTTLGYGDMAPAAPIARFMAYAEAVTGQFYIAILVASLVGIRISTHRNDQLR